MTQSENIIRELKRYKEKLSDFSGRNRELYFKERNSTSINLSMFPFQLNLLHAKDKDKFTPLRFMNLKITDLVSLKNFNLHEHFLLEKLSNNEASAKFLKKLEKLKSSDDRHQKEFGISGAWLLGPFLCWQSPFAKVKEDLMISPIFKIAINLEKNKNKKMILKIEEAEFKINPTLMHALKVFNNIDLEDCDQCDEILDFFLILQKKFAEKKINLEILNDNFLAIQEKKEIYKKLDKSNFIIFDVAYIDQLQANRMSLFNDYEYIIENSNSHPILNELFNGVSASVSNSDHSRQLLKELDVYKERENYFVIDIDSTQHRAIDQVNKSKAIVIQGPPGTGKSQTIVNLIANSLAKGKKVLFVSEKRAALDVVFNRLKSTKIDSHAVLIHSSDLNKNELYQNFLTLSSARQSQASQKEWEVFCGDFDQKKKQLNDYAEIIQQQHAESDFNNSELILEASSRNKENYIHELFHKLKHLSLNEVSKISENVKNIQNISLQYPNCLKSVWMNKQRNIVRNLTLEHELLRIDKRVYLIKCDNEKLSQKFYEITGLELSNNKNLFNNIFKLDSLSNTFDSIWKLKDSKDNFIMELKLLKEKIYSKLNTINMNYNMSKAIKPQSDLSVLNILIIYYSKTKTIIDYFSYKFWKMRKIRNEICANWDSTNKQFIAYKEYFLAKNEVINLISKITGEKNDKDYASNEGIVLSCKIVIEYIDKLLGYIQIYTDFKLHNLSNLSLESFSAFNSAVEQFNETIDIVKKFNENMTEIKVIEDDLRKIINIDNTNLDVDELYHTICCLRDELDYLVCLDRIELLIEKTEFESGYLGISDLLKNTLYPTNQDWAELILDSCLIGWTDHLYSTSPKLRSFDSQLHQSLIQSFKNLSERHKILSSQAVHQAFAKRWAKSKSNEPALALLKNESMKQRKVISPREIMEKGALQTMLELKPCWLMSPLSISQILPNKAGIFDIIIFDEASQVRVEDAVPSIFRANTMVVVGDQNQMPPTNFFSSSAVDESDDAEEELSKSILDLALQAYPSVLLEWHYRSKFEALIAYSNRAFYGGRLIAAPNPQQLIASNAIEYHFVEDACYDSKKGNEVEAKAVISKLIELLSTYPDKSFGIIAMGKTQALALEEELSQRMESDSKVNRLLEKALTKNDSEFDSGLFIKNLENVQGDERDIIFLTIGYAPSELGQKLSKNFGPVIKNGGGRRLNVAITRAKEKMLVFSSFSPSEIPIDETAFTQNADLCVFGRFLKYAEAIQKKNEEVVYAILNSFPISGIISSRKSSKFALDVKRRLESLGYQVSTEIGTNGFYIDLAVHHPAVPSNFLLGIECDGAIFHSTPYARDRDKIRENLLVSRGWRIERIWSQDWSRSWQTEVARIDKVIKQYLNC